MKTLLTLWLLAIPLLAADVRLAWDANTETDIQGYKLFWSTNSGAYSSFIATTNLTATVSNVLTGTTYFSAKAINSEGVESDFSDEVAFTNSLTNKFIVVLGTGSITQGTAITEILKSKKWDVLNKMEGIWFVMGEDITSRALAEEITRSPLVGGKVKLVIKVHPDGTMTHWGNASKDMWDWMAKFWGKSG